ncbi:MAG: urea ABC transporter permease subunit UrtB [Myxococcota bacterium]
MQRTLLCLALALVFGGAARASTDGFESMLGELAGKSFRRKSEAIQAIADSGHPAAPRILRALLESRAFFAPESERLLLDVADSGEGVVVDAITGEATRVAFESGRRKIVLNNAMRRLLRSLVARAGLASRDPRERRQAIKELMGRDDPEIQALLREALEIEQARDVRSLLETAIAIGALREDDADAGSDAEARLRAIEALSGSLHNESRIALDGLLTRLESRQSKSSEEEAQIGAIREAIDAIDRRKVGFEILETLFFGVSLGFVLVLAAIGLAITFGVMGVINMAHGEMIMLGAYSTWSVQQLMPHHLESSVLVAIPVAFLVSALVGVAIERGVVRFLYGRPLETLLATFGISLFLQQSVRTIFSPLNRAVASPSWMSGQWVLNDAFALNYNRLWIIVFSALVFAALIGVLHRTRLGLQIRAVAQNRAMARAMGVRGARIDAITFGLGSGIAGLAGVALSQLTNVGPNLGQAHIVDSFMVVVFGGVGNLWGTLVAGLTLGVTNKLLEPFAGAVLAKILVLVFIILFIQRRPRGLFPQQGRSAEA